jgi:hypothetical protein
MFNPVMTKGEYQPDDLAAFVRHSMSAVDRYGSYQACVLIQNYYNRYLKSRTKTSVNGRRRSLPDENYSADWTIPSIFFHYYCIPDAEHTETLINRTNRFMLMTLARNGLFMTSSKTGFPVVNYQAAKVWDKLMSRFKSSTKKKSE